MTEDKGLYVQLNTRKYLASGKSEKELLMEGWEDYDKA